MIAECWTHSGTQDLSYGQARAIPQVFIKREMALLCDNTSSKLEFGKDGSLMNHFEIIPLSVELDSRPSEKMSRIHCRREQRSFPILAAFNCFQLYIGSEPVVFFDTHCFGTKAHHSFTISAWQSPCIKRIAKASKWTWDWRLMSMSLSSWILQSSTSTPQWVVAVWPTQTQDPTELGLVVSYECLCPLWKSRFVLWNSNILSNMAIAPT